MEGIKMIKNEMAKVTRPQNAQMRPKILPHSSLNEVGDDCKGWLSSILVKTIFCIY